MLLTLGGFDVSAGQLVAVAAVLLLSATHYVGIREGSRIQGLLTSLIVVALVALGVGGLFAKASASVPAFGPPAGPISLAAFGTAMVGVFWCYYGWSEIAAVAGEVRRPTRNLPLALIGGTTLVMLLYVGANVAFLKTMSVGELAHSDHPATVAATTLFGSGAAVESRWPSRRRRGLPLRLDRPGPRIAYALAKDRLFFPRFGVRIPASTPRVRDGRAGDLDIASVLSGRTSALHVCDVRRDPRVHRHRNRALRVPARLPTLRGRTGAGDTRLSRPLFVLSSAALAINTVRAQPKETLAGLAILLLGVPVYFWRRSVREGAVAA